MPYLTRPTATGVVKTSLDIWLYTCCTFHVMAAARRRLLPYTPACSTFVYRTANPQPATCPSHRKHNLDLVVGPSVKTNFYSAFLMVMSGAGNVVRSVLFETEFSVSLPFIFPACRTANMSRTVFGNSCKVVISRV